jgi:uncharacterized protein (TIGR02271 family)
MTRSEEELRVGKTQRESGRARLRKYVVTEQVQKTVPVQREEVRVEREPITDANVGDAKAGPAISEEEHEVVLHEEVEQIGRLPLSMPSDSGRRVDDNGSNLPDKASRWVRCTCAVVRCAPQRF